MARRTLYEHIAEDLKRRLRLRGGAGAPLSLEEVAVDYGCSTRPVRAAFARLVEEGVLERLANRRYRPARKASRQASPAKPEPFPQRDPYPEVSRYVVGLGVGGGEAFAREEETAQRFGLSRARVRSLFERLAAEGLLEHLPRRGWRVRPFDRADMSDFLEVRVLLETKALELAWPRLEEGRLRRFLEFNRLNGPGERPDPDNALHGYWIGVSGNRYIQNFFRQNARYFEILFSWEDQDEAAAREACLQHQEILESILAGRKRDALRALRRHIRHNHPVLMRMGSG